MQKVTENISILQLEFKTSERGNKLKIINKKQVTLGIRLKELLKEKCMHQAALDTVCIKDNGDGVSTTSINAWCTDKSIPRKKQLVQLAEFFDVDIEYLQCKQLEKRRSKKKDINIFEKYKTLVSDEELEEVKRSATYEKMFDEIFNHFKVKRFDAPLTYETFTHTYQILEDGYIYTVEDTNEVGVDCNVYLDFPDGKGITISPDEYEALKKDIEQFISFKFEQLKKNHEYQE